MSDADPKSFPVTKHDDRSPAAERNRVLYKIRRYAHRRWPVRFADPDLSMYEKSWRTHDAQENEETEPPPDEYIDLICVWASEYYVPAHIGMLLQNLAALGWDHDDFGRRNVVRWVQELRERALGSGYFSLGAIVRPDDTRLFSARRHGPLPDHVDYATGTVFSITSSITCVSIQFILRDCYAQRINEALRTKYETRFEPLHRGHRVHSPRFLKQAAIDAIRAEIRTLAADWFRTQLPGVFAAGPIGGEFPTCEFMTLRVGKPFTRMTDPAGRRSRYLEALDLEQDVRAWQSERVHALQFSEPSFRRGKHRLHTILAANEADLPEDELDTYGGRDRSGLAAFAHNHIKDLLLVWGLVPLISGYERHLNFVRDSALLRPRSSDAPRRVLERLRDLVSQSADMAAVAVELADSTESKFLLRHIGTFTPANSALSGDEKDVTLAEGLRWNIQRRAEWIQRTERATRDLLIQFGSVLSAHENIKLQNSVRRLTWILVVLTVLITILTVIMANQNLGTITEMLWTISGWS